MVCNVVFCGRCGNELTKEEESNFVHYSNEKICDSCMTKTGFTKNELQLKKGDLVLIKARVEQTGLDYGQVACVVQSFEGDPDLEPEQVFVVTQLDIQEPTTLAEIIAELILDGIDFEFEVESRRVISMCFQKEDDVKSKLKGLLLGI